jgi:hypothetical protein
MSLVDSISTVLKTQTANVAVPKGFDSPGTVDYSRGTGTITAEGPLASEDYRGAFEKATGMPVPAGQDVILERATLQEGPDGAQRWWYKFKFVQRSLDNSGETPRLLELFAWAKNQPPVTKLAVDPAAQMAVLNIADLQIGKTDRWGGTAETQSEFYRAVELMKDYLARHGLRRACLTELGDGAENFQNTPTQAQTNDRQLIEQLDTHTELLTYAAAQLSTCVDELIVAGVPSNHMEVREDGKAVGGVHNDYGLLSLSNVKRSFKLNPDAFGHVQFAWPDEHEVSMTLDLAGVPVGLAHGHYSRGAGAADGVPKWLNGQFAGNHPLQPAHIIVTAHFHHLRMQNIIGGRWWFQAPTLDRGSSWLERSTGEGNSQNGILAFTVGNGSWSNWELLRTF